MKRPQEMIEGQTHYSQFHPWTRCQKGHLLNFWPYRCLDNIRCDLWTGEDWCTRERGHEGIHGTVAS